MFYVVLGIMNLNEFNGKILLYTNDVNGFGNNIS